MNADAQPHLPAASLAESAEERVRVVTAALSRRYGVRAAAIVPIPAGTSTWNYTVTSDQGEQRFAKVYRDRAAVAAQREAIEVARFARAGGLAVPDLVPTLDGGIIAEDGRVAVSLWEYLPHTRTAEGALDGPCWEAVGAEVGRLHRRLAEHPAARPRLSAGTGVCDPIRATQRYDRALSGYAARSGLDTFERWAFETLRRRRDLLPEVAELVDALPALTTQVLHGDLASPNLLLNGEAVAGIVDFRPPRRGFTAWEIGRIACDPQSVLRTDPAGQWLPGLLRFADAYRDQHPGGPVRDLVFAPRCTLAYTLTSLYPLAEPLDAPDAVDDALRVYGRRRHETAMLLLERLEEVEEALRDHLD
jgi:Ser/Thr protein kinase RdoA (MazF antagonist)